MKKFLGMLLGITLVFTLLSAVNFAFNSSPAEAATPLDTNGANSTQHSDGTNTPKFGVEAAGTIDGNGKPPQEVPGGSCFLSNNCWQPPVVVPPPPRTECIITYGGQYPIGSARDCNFTIIGQDKQEKRGNCPVNNNLSAVYVTYDETLYYKSVSKSNNVSFSTSLTTPFEPSKFLRWSPTDIRRYDNDSMKVLAVAISASGTLSTPNRSVFPTKGLFPISPPSYSKQTVDNYYAAMDGISAEWSGMQILYLQSLTPTSVFSNIKCIYPVKPEVQALYTVTCFLYYDSFLYKDDSKTGIRSGGALVGTRKGLKAGQVADINNPNNYGVTVENHLNCDNDYFYTTEQYNLIPPEEGGYGYYRLDVKAYVTECSVEGYPSWTGNHSMDKITDCTPPKYYATYNAYAVYSCKGFAKIGDGLTGWRNLPDNENFSLSACVDFRCDITGSLQIGGTTNPLQVMRNGENIPVTYPNISIATSEGGTPPAEGATVRPENGATSWEAVTGAASGVISGSSPFRGTNDEVNNIKQYFGLRTANGDTKVTFLTARNGDLVNKNNSNPSTAWQPQLSNGVPNENFLKGFTNFNWASSKGADGIPKAWNMFRSFRIHGEFYVPVADTTSGASTMQWQKETKYCGNVISNPITVVRSVNEIK